MAETPVAERRVIVCSERESDARVRVSVRMRAFLAAGQCEGPRALAPRGVVPRDHMNRFANIVR
jgi:hypothetical protein